MTENNGNKQTGTLTVKSGLAKMLKGGVIMDVTNPEEAERLASDEGRERFADVMARAIRIYFARQSIES